MKLQSRDIKLAIFDMDGTLIDSTGKWGEIDREFFAKRGIDTVPEDYGKQIVHLGLEKGAEMTIEKYGFVNDTVEGIIKEWRDASMHEYLYNIPLKPYAKEILEYFKQNGVLLALATANDSDLYLPCLKRLNIYNYFDYIIDVNVVKEGKTSPKIYNSVCEKFNIKQSEAVVFEDTPTGLKTAKEAGFFVVGVDDKASLCAEEEKKSYSDIYIYSFKELIK